VRRASGERTSRPKQLVLCERTFEAQLGGRSCPLGNTIEFRLLARLNQRPGWYVSVAQLRADVWQDEHTTKYTIQRTVCNLRRRLRAHGLTDLVIDGQQRDHYRLVLNP